MKSYSQSNHRDNSICKILKNIKKRDITYNKGDVFIMRSFANNSKELIKIGNITETKINNKKNITISINKTSNNSNNSFNLKILDYISKDYVHNYKLNIINSQDITGMVFHISRFRFNYYTAYLVIQKKNLSLRYLCYIYLSKNLVSSLYDEIDIVEIKEDFKYYIEILNNNNRIKELITKLSKNNINSNKLNVLLEFIKKIKNTNVPKITFEI